MRYLLLLSFILMLGIGPAYSREKETTLKNPEEALSFRNPNVIEINGQLILLEPPPAGYVRPGFESTAKALWAIRAFRYDDAKALNEFAQITNCELYQQYKFNDFQLNRIKEGLITDTSLSMSSLPTRFEIVSGAQLDQYDFNQGGFLLTEKSQIKGIGSIFLYKMERRSISECQETIKLVQHPQVTVVSFEKRLDFKIIPMKQEQAEALIKKMNEEKNRARNISLAIRLRVIGMDSADKQRIAGQSGETRFVVKGKIESIAVYSDLRLRDKIFETTFE